MQIPPSEADYIRAGRSLLGAEAAADHPTARAAGGAEVADDPTAGVSSSVAVVNVALAASLDDDALLTLQIRGKARAFRVPPVACQTGIRLHHFEGIIAQHWEALRALDDRNPHSNPEAERLMAALVLAYVEVAHLMWAAVRPAERWRRWLWRMRGRPRENLFLALEFPDMHRALAFFSHARTNTRLAWQSSDRAPRSLTWTWPATLSPTGPSGSAPADRTATRAPGATSASA